MKDLELCVCLKSVPDPRQPVESWLDPQTGIVKRRADELAVPRVISPLDRHALEEALRIKEMLSGRVTVISMDTEAACDVLKETLALGADQAVLLSDRTFAGADTLATARCCNSVSGTIRPDHMWQLELSWQYRSGWTATSGDLGDCSCFFCHTLGVC
jgi:electron transfer flavoprotein beta subunit